MITYSYSSAQQLWGPLFNFDFWFIGPNVSTTDFIYIRGNFVTIIGDVRKFLSPDRPNNLLTNYINLFCNLSVGKEARVMLVVPGRIQQFLEDGLIWARMKNRYELQMIVDIQINSLKDSLKMDVHFSIFKLGEGEGKSKISTSNWS